MMGKVSKAMRLYWEIMKVQDDIERRWKNRNKNSSYKSRQKRRARREGRHQHHYLY